MFSAKRILLGPIKGYIDSRYPQWKLDAALRYLPVADHLKRSGHCQVLDVGPGDLGLSQYWGCPTIGVDLSVPACWRESLMQPVLGSGAALPFKDRSMDAVVCVDVLEHIPEENRSKVISELIRVSGRDLILAVPCGDSSQRTDSKLEEVFERKTGTLHPWLREHLAYGLPEAGALAEEILSLARKQGRTAHTREKKNVNLVFWHGAYHLYFAGTPKIQRLIGYYLLALIPILRRINWGRTYRRIFFVRFEPENSIPIQKE